MTCRFTRAVRLAGRCALGAGLTGLCQTTASSAPSGPPVALAGRRIVIFEAPGFPARGPRPAAWYQAVLTNAGWRATRVGIDALADPGAIDTARVDVVLLATGGGMPLEAEEALDRFMRQGGTIALDGHMLAEHPAYPPAIQADYEALAGKARAGQAGDALQAFIWEQGLPAGSAFRYAPALKRWIAPVGAFVYNRQIAQPFMGFELIPWPNHASAAAQYHRPHDQPLRLHPDLARAARAHGLPETLPPAGRPLLRMQLPARLEGAYHEYVNDRIVSVYQFTNVSGRSYSGIPRAGINAWDRETDFFIYRSHTAWKSGFTLLHFGQCGAGLLASEHGAAALLAGLALAAAPLPGERDAAFIDACHRLDAALSRHSGLSIEAIDALAKTATLQHYRGETNALRQTVAGLMRIRRRYEAACQAGRQSRAQAAAGSGHAERLVLIARCRAEADEAEAVRDRCARVLASLPPSAPLPAVTNAFKQFMFGFRNLKPADTGRLKAAAPLLRGMGMTLGPYYVSQTSFADAGRMYREAGIQTGFRVSYPERAHPAKRPFDGRQLDPELGTLKPYRGSWFETPDDWIAYERDVGWLLRQAARQPGLGYIVYLSERNMGWSLWGPRMETRFQQHLQSVYTDIGALNQTWGAAFKQFTNIQLPVKRPVTQTDHAHWEDWTRYREIYRMREEVRPMVEIVERNAPGCWSLKYGSYHEHHSMPANGVNFYELGKAGRGPGTLEHQLSLRSEILSADIAGFHHRNLTSEWGAYYTPLATEPDQTDLLTQEIWRGIAWGQVGMHTFVAAGAPDRTDVRWLSADMQILPLGWQMTVLNRDLQRIAPILLDGAREEPPVRILYSPTTRRHTSWPRIERDKSLEAVAGWYRALQELHVPARAIDEGAILDGHLTAATRLLIVPQATYLPRALHRLLLDFVREGGTLLITPDSGQFDEHGHRRDALLGRAGVAPAPVAEPLVDLGAGRRLRPTAYLEKASALEVLFPGRTETVAAYADGRPAVTSTRSGNGSILVAGLPFGQLYQQEWSQAPAAPLHLLRRMIAAAGVSFTYDCSDPRITIWPWRYRNGRYLMLTSPTRPGMVGVPAPGGEFPFRRPPLMTPFTLRIAGSVRLRDCLLNHPLPGRFDGTHTLIEGLIASPGGLLVEVKAGTGASATPAAAVQADAAPAAAAAATGTQAGAVRTLPYHGRLLSDDGPVMLGDYRVSMEVDSLGGTWQGALILRVERDGEVIRKPCRSGETTQFPFLARIFEVQCESASAVMPVGLLAAFRERERTAPDAACSLTEEPFRGQTSLVLENALLRVRLLPDLGGRIVEFVSRSDGENQVHCQGEGPALVGGLKENAGAYPGPFMKRPFTATRLTETPDEVRVRLSSPELVKEFVLKKGEARLSAVYRLFNRREAGADLKLRTHAEFTPGGQVSSDDGCFYPVGPSGKRIPFRVGHASPFFENLGGWLAVCDAGRRKGVIQTFRTNAVGKLYYCMSEQACNFEATTPEEQVAPGQALEFACDWGLIQGVSGVAGYAAGVAVEIATPESGVFGRGAAVPLVIEATALWPVDCLARIAIERPDGSRTNLHAATWRLAPDAPIRLPLDWNTGRLPDGDYRIVVDLRIPDGSPLLTTVRELRLAGDRQAALHAETQPWRERLQERIATSRALADGEAREREMAGATRLAVLLNAYEAAVAATDAAAIEALRGDIQWLLDPPEDHAPAE